MRIEPANDSPSQLRLSLLTTKLLRRVVEKSATGRAKDDGSGRKGSKVLERDGATLLNDLISNSAKRTPGPSASNPRVEKIGQVQTSRIVYRSDTSRPKKKIVVMCYITPYHLGIYPGDAIPTWDLYVWSIPSRHGLGMGYTYPVLP